MQMPAMLYGTAWKQADTARLVALAIAEGFRGIDTACQPKHYHEPGVGEGIAASLDKSLTRADLYIQTKFTSVPGQDPTSIPYDSRAPLAAQVAESFEVSLRNLRTDYLDGLVLHGPLATIAETLEVWRAMESRVDEHRVRQLGVSNFYHLPELKALHRAARIKPSIVQNRFHAETRYDREIRLFCRTEGLVYQSFWTLTANANLLAHPTIVRLGLAYGRSPAQILFRYLIHSGVVPLTGTRSQNHMREDLATADFELAPAERTAVDRILGDDSFTVP